MKAFLIDDNEIITTLIVEFLEVNGIECIVENDPRRGLEKIKNEQFDVILLDNHMPKLYGIDVIDSLEKQGILPSLKIVFFSGADFTGSQIDYLLSKKGIKAILKKPTPLKELFSVLVS